MPAYYALMQSPLGPILLRATGGQLSGLYFTDQKDCPLPGLDKSRPPASSSFRPGDLAASLQAVTGQPAFSQAAAWPEQSQEVFENTAQQLDDYFFGNRVQFDLPLRLEGTPFQETVWHQLINIPYGKTVSYRQLAEQAGFTAGHSRPVGTAVGRNPLSILVPCHRVLGHDGGLHGYAGGLDRKQHLLVLEGALLT